MRLFSFAVFVLINSVLAVPQRNSQRVRQQQRVGQDGANPDVQKAIDEVFTTPRPITTKTPFDALVTPDSTYTPTSSPQVLTNNQSQQCTCVPYHLCDPNSQTIKSQADQDEVTGFGLIDIRFQSDLRDCEEILDVCCIGAAKREESIVPKPVENVPTRAAGCGVRNVDGLDFKITGAYVSLTAKSPLGSSDLYAFFAKQDNEAGFGEFPWTVAIIRIEDDACICGGSLIHPKAVLTGNHCVRE